MITQSGECSPEYILLPSQFTAFEARVSHSHQTPNFFWLQLKILLFACGILIRPDVWRHTRVMQIVHIASLLHSQCQEGNMSLAEVRIARCTFGIYKLDKLFKFSRDTEVRTNHYTCAQVCTNSTYLHRCCFSCRRECIISLYSTGYSLATRPIPNTVS